MRPVKTAIMPVAGFGTRVLPATKSIPKEMLPIVDRPAIQYVVDEALAAGIEHICFVTGRNKSAIEDYFDSAYELEEALERKGKNDILKMLKDMRLPASVSSFTRQQAALGLGHAVWCAKAVAAGEPVAVLLPDVIIKSEKSCLAQMMDAYREVGGNIIAVDAVPEKDVSKYGVIDLVTFLVRNWISISHVFFSVLDLTQIHLTSKRIVIKGTLRWTLLFWNSSASAMLPVI